jgi:hypothetical protein
MEPDEKKTVKIPVWDLETDEIIEMEIDQEALDAMDEATRKAEERREEARKREREDLRYVRDDDY